MNTAKSAAAVAEAGAARKGEPLDRAKLDQMKAGITAVFNGQMDVFATSARMLDDEMRQQKVLATTIPAIFLFVAAFLINVVLGRLVGVQREQIAALKALGYEGIGCKGPACSCG